MVEPSPDENNNVPPPRRSSSSFAEAVVSAKGVPQLLVLIMLLSLGFGSTIGVVPAVMSDRYARLNHGYGSNERYCSDYVAAEDKPGACLAGSADAQNAVALQQLVSNGLAFFTSPLFGSMSDEYGRKGFLVLGVFLSTLSPLLLVLVQVIPEMSPDWYYGIGSLSGLVSFNTIALSAVSDVMPPMWRAPSFGMLLAFFSFGIAMSPHLTILLGHFKVSLVSFALVLVGLVVMIVLFPETLPPQAAEGARLAREEEMQGLSENKRLFWNVIRPMRELSIINRNRMFRLLAVLAFFSTLVASGDHTLVIYYVEERLGFTDKDVAVLIMIAGILGIVVQGVVLKVLVDSIGERLVVTACFILGTIQNLIYGMAHQKSLFFAGVTLGPFVGMAYPTISAIKSKLVEESEQGRVQGALYSLSSLASALGPIVLRSVYNNTKDSGSCWGAGTMFVFAAQFYVVAVFCACALPREANSKPENSSAITMTMVDDDSDHLLAEQHAVRKSYDALP